MTEYVLDEYDIRSIHPARKRFNKIKEILTTEEDESKRWDCVWLAGEICDICPKTDRIQTDIADLMCWLLVNDPSGIVKHEAAFQIGLRNFRDKIPNLIDCILNDNSDVAVHEAIEALGLMRVFDAIPILQKLVDSPRQAVSETAIFVIKRLERMKGKGEYRGEAIV